MKLTQIINMKELSYKYYITPLLTAIKLIPHSPDRQINNVKQVQSKFLCLQLMLTLVNCYNSSKMQSISKRLPVYLRLTAFFS